MATIDEALAVAIQHHQAGRLAEAEAIYLQILRLQPDHADALHLLGLVARRAGRLDQAAALIGRALQIRPAFPEAWFNLGNVFQAQGRRAEAIALFERSIALRPDYPDSHYNLALAFQSQNRAPEAVEAYRRAIALRPDHAEAYANLGATLHGLSRFDEAIAAYRQALALNPDFPEVHANLGASFYSQGYLTEAVAAFRGALDRRPDYAKAHSNLLMCLNYDAGLDARAVFAEHLAWEVRHGRPPAEGDSGGEPHGNAPDPDRPLRIGYVSPDLLRHPVGYFLYGVAKHHDRERFHVTFYSGVQKEDELTAQFKAMAQGWRPTFGVGNEDLARRIRDDGIDVLIDLAGHTAGNRLPVFALRPAPVQVTWLGYPNTTGMAAMDYRVVDDVTDPVGIADAIASETLVRLPGGFLCYVPMTEAPPVSPLPCRTDGHITFGSLNNVAKVTPAVAEVWSDIVRRVPGSRLLLKSKQLSDPAVRERYMLRFTAHGLEPERVELIGWEPSIVDHYALYHRIDIALDPFPYNGTTTTCDALWMGVPVVTWAWDRHSGRVGASLLTRIGLPDLVAPTRGSYVELAAELAGDRARLAELRATMRERMQRSPLCDARGFTRSLEAAYRRMWRRWCDGLRPGGGPGYTDGA